MKINILSPRWGQHTVLLDDADFELVSRYRWSIKGSVKTHRAFYAYGTGNVYMHRLIMQPKPNEYVDHIDGNGLNNYRSNLRLCNSRQNLYNQQKTLRPTSSIYKGVSFELFSNRWRAYISVDGIRRSLGRYKTEVEAANAYNTAALLYYGSFAKLNTILK